MKGRINAGMQLLCHSKVYSLKKGKGKAEKKTFNVICTKQEKI